MILCARSFEAHMKEPMNNLSFGETLRYKLDQAKIDYWLVLVVPNLNSSYGYSKPAVSLYFFMADMACVKTTDKVAYVEC